MSWRLLFAVLIIAAGASAWAGLQLGDWLVAHAPEGPAAPEYPELAGQVILDADGRPFVAKAPQPLVTGRQAIPETPEPVQWDIQPEGIQNVLSNPLISVDTTPISMEEARQLASLGAGGQNGIEGIADLGNLTLTQRAPGAMQPLQPIETASPPAPDFTPSEALNQAAQQLGGNWQQQLRQELDACSNAGFFSRPSCAWAARNKYCGPNNAWGQIAECPPRN